MFHQRCIQYSGYLITGKVEQENIFRETELNTKHAQMDNHMTTKQTGGHGKCRGNSVILTVAARNMNLKLEIYATIYRALQSFIRN